MSDLSFFAQAKGAANLPVPIEIVITIVLVALVFFSMVMLLVRRYKRCPSNKVLVIYGKWTGSPTGTRCIQGGARLVLADLALAAPINWTPEQFEQSNRQGEILWTLQEAGEHWKAPELFFPNGRNKQEQPRPAEDVWPLGKMLLQLAELTEGEMPFLREAAAACQHADPTKRPAPGSHLVRWISTD